MNKLQLTAAVLMTIFWQAGVSQDSWQNYFSSTDLEINYKKAECHDPANGIHKSLVLLQYVNHGAKPVSVTFNRQVWYNGKCSGCDQKPEDYYSVKLDANQTISGSCDNRHSKALFIFDKMLDVDSRSLTKFELVDIKIQEE